VNKEQLTRCAWTQVATYSRALSEAALALTADDQNEEARMSAGLAVIAIDAAFSAAIKHRPMPLPAEAVSLYQWADAAACGDIDEQTAAQIFSKFK
jgi:hypothetical protein